MIEPANDLDGLLKAMEGLGRAYPAVVRVLPGLSRDELATFPHAVPEPEYTLLRHMRGFVLNEVTDHRLRFGPGVGEQDARFGPEGISAIDTGDFSACVTNDSGAPMVPVHRHLHDTFGVDIDPVTGKWGPVFGDGPDTGMDCQIVYQARSIIDWWAEIATAVALRLADPSPNPDPVHRHLPIAPHPALARALFPWDLSLIPHLGHIPADRTRYLYAPPVSDALADIDPDGLVFDLRAVNPPVFLYETNSSEFLRIEGHDFVVGFNP